MADKPKRPACPLHTCSLKGHCNFHHSAACSTRPMSKVEFAAKQTGLQLEPAVREPTYNYYAGPAPVILPPAKTFEPEVSREEIEKIVYRNRKATRRELVEEMLTNFRITRR